MDVKWNESMTAIDITYRHAFSLGLSLIKYIMQNKGCFEIDKKLCPLDLGVFSTGCKYCKDDVYE